MDGLPDELLLQIFHYVTPFDLVNISSLNSRYEKLILERALWSDITCTSRFTTLEEVDYFTGKIHPETRTFRVNIEPTSKPTTRSCVNLKDIEAKLAYNHLSVLALEGIYFDNQALILKDYPQCLQEISFNESLFEDGGGFFRHAGRNLRKLRVITLEHCLSLQEGIITTLGNFPALEIISLNGCMGVRDALMSLTFDARAGYPQLKCLDVRCTGLGGDMCAAATGMRQLGELYFHCYFDHLQSAAKRKLGKRELGDLLRYRSVNISTRAGVVEAEDAHLLYQYDANFSDHSLGVFRLKRHNGDDYIPPKSVLYRRPYSAECTCGWETLAPSVCRYPEDRDAKNLKATSISGNCGNKSQLPTIAPSVSSRNVTAPSMESSNESDRLNGSIESSGVSSNRKGALEAPSTVGTSRGKSKSAPSISENNLEDSTVPSSSRDASVDDVTVSSEDSSGISTGECTSTPSVDATNVVAPSSGDTSASDVTMSSADSGTSTGECTSTSSVNNPRKRRLSKDGTTPSVDSASKCSTTSSTTCEAPPMKQQRLDACNGEGETAPSTQQDKDNTDAGNMDGDGDDDDALPSATAFQPYFRLANGREVRARDPHAAHVYAQQAGRVFEIALGGARGQFAHGPPQPPPPFHRMDDGMFVVCRLPPPMPPPPLAGIPLRRLALRGVPQLGDGVVEQLRHLDLELLDVTRTSVTAAGVAQLRRLMPQCRIIHEAACRCAPR